jgi:metal-dependent amidase/aminoacylase/carboxypeptidase family protein
LQFYSGEAINTVPSNGYLEGTIRTYDATDLNIVKNQMNKIAKFIVAGYPSSNLTSQSTLNNNFTLFAILFI